MNAQKVGNIWIDLAELKECVDLTTVFGAGNLLCPWHEDHTPSLHVYTDHVHCFSCGATADAITFVRKLYQLSFSQAVHFLLRYKQRSRVRRIRVTTPVEGELVTSAHQQLLELSSRTLAWRWLHQRGLTLSIIRALTIGWTGRTYSIPHFANGQAHNIKYRVHPHWQRQDEPKYQSLKHRGFQFLYPWDYFRQHYSQSPVLFVTEGELDALLLLQSNLPAVSVPSGVNTAWTPWIPFFRQFKHIYILYDMDEAGDAAANKLLTKRGKIGKTVVEMLEPTIVQRLTWRGSWGNDVTEAQGVLGPKLRRVYEQSL